MITDDLPNEFKFIKSSFDNEFSQVQTHITQAKQVNITETKPFLEGFLNKYRDNILLYSGTQEAHCVIELRDNLGVFQALAALGMVLKQRDKVMANPRYWGDIRIWQGVVAFVLCQQGMSKSAVRANRNALQKMAQQYGEQLNKLAIRDVQV